MENILFEYPVNNENSSFDDEFQVQKAKMNCSLLTIKIKKRITTSNIKALKR